MDSNNIILPEYGDSWGLIIGINKYQNISPLQFARNDADEVAKTLVSGFGFSSDKVKVLLDGEATKQKIEENYMQIVQSTNINDRVFIFFAGHGHSIEGEKAMEGFFMPVEAKLDSMSTWLGWELFTGQNSRVMKAKHQFIVIDACFGGTSFKRKMQPGTERFLDDIMKRTAVQLLSSGKHDQEVDDGNGPIPNHSIFTGYFLQSLAEQQVTNNVVTANTIMQNVYRSIAQDDDANQTPNFGNLRGDGDFVFMKPDRGQESDEAISNPIRVTIPENIGETVEQHKDQSEIFIEEIKEYLSDPKLRIKLDDKIASELRYVQEELIKDRFSMHAVANESAVIERLHEYEILMYRLIEAITLLCRWGNDSHWITIEKIYSRIAETALIAPNGVNIYLNLRWYPVLLLLYAGGISATAAGNYSILTKIFAVPIQDNFEREARTILDKVVSEIYRSNLSENLFKKIPEHVRKIVPISEYLLTVIQPPINDLLYLGQSYESTFDVFEILLALSYAYSKYTIEDEYLWAPAGRFYWKYKNDNSSTYHRLLDDARKEKENWPPTLGKLFGANSNNFIKYAERYAEIMKRRSDY